MDRAALIQTGSAESQLEFIRDPTLIPDATLDRIFGKLGRSSDGAALLFCHTQLFVIPVADVLGFPVTRILPGKYGGGSNLQVECRTGYDAVPTKSVTITNADGTNDLNDLAATLSRAFDRPYTLGEPVFET